MMVAKGALEKRRLLFVKTSLADHIFRWPTRADMPYDITKYPFLIDGAGVTSKELVDQAGLIDPKFADQFYRTPDRAAQILKADGRTVSDNPKYKPH